MSASNFSTNLDVYTFDFKDTNPSLINSLRRIAYGHIPVMSLSHVVIKKNDSSVKDEVLLKNIRCIRFDQEKIPNKLFMELDITATENIRLVTADDLKFSQTVPQLFLKGIYLCALEKGKRLKLAGNFESKIENTDGAHSCVARFGYEETTSGVYKVTVHILEVYSFRALMKLACDTLVELLEGFEKEIFQGKQTNIRGFRYETSKYDMTVLNLVVSMIHELYPLIDFASYVSTHQLIPLYALILHSTMKQNEDAIIHEAVKAIIAKIRRVRKTFADLSDEKYTKIWSQV